MFSSRSMKVDMAPPHIMFQPISGFFSRRETSAVLSSFRSSKAVASPDTLAPTTITLDKSMVLLEESY